jgi:hypothetical protein
LSDVRVAKPKDYCGYLLSLLEEIPQVCRVEFLHPSILIIEYDGDYIPTSSQEPVRKDIANALEAAKVYTVNALGREALPINLSERLIHTRDYIMRDWPPKMKLWSRDPEEDAQREHDKLEELEKFNIEYRLIFGVDWGSDEKVSEV